MIYMGGLYECLAGYTTEMEAVASEFLFLFNQKGPSPQLGGSRGNCQTCGPSSDYSHVKIILDHDFLQNLIKMPIMSILAICPC